MPATPPPAPFPGPPAPTMETGGPVPPAPVPAPPAPPGKPFGGFFEGITWMDVGMVALVSLALYYSIYASRQVIANLKTQQNQTAQDISALKSQVQSLMPASSSS